MPPATIRNATATDLSEILAILNQQITESVASFRIAPLDDAAGRRWFAAHTDPKYPVIVAAADGKRPQSKLAGWASLSAWSDYEAYHRTAEISVWIRPECQRQGLGRRLMEEIIARAVAVQHRVILSRVEADNVGSLKLHESLGFRTIGTMHRVGEKFGRLLDVVMLERLLE
ncbi:GNAT family N-acetyltransferase [Roseimaritima ulvae]|uniref:N-acyltransferase YncA n=1 Tax=Roseimaritima ulvae TaxID=980254 RepID=A0A5B9QMX9_9BACT|nr:GNAT family N-acetyltransferase [Roseimaritima ulvae]QEG38835.1 N-acyltransferase YncA [Roseimaritima ulvae]